MTDNMEQYHWYQTPERKAKAEEILQRAICEKAHENLNIILERIWNAYDLSDRIQEWKRAVISAPIAMRLNCPSCGDLHIDEGQFATKAHHTHACQNCGMVWRPAIEPTVGVQFLPGFKNV